MCLSSRWHLHAAARFDRGRAKNSVATPGAGSCFAVCSAIGVCEEWRRTDRGSCACRVHVPLLAVVPSPRFPEAVTAGRTLGVLPQRSCIRP